MTTINSIAKFFGIGSKYIKNGPKIKDNVLSKSIGLENATKSANESMGVFAKADVEKISQKAKFNPEKINQNLGIGKSVKSAKDSAKAFLKQGAKKPSAWKNVAKWGLIGLGIAGLIGAGVYLLKKYKDTNATANLPTKPTPTPAPTKQTKPTKPAEKTKPSVKTDKNQENPSKSNVSTEYTVKKGDNLWNIAKQYLKDLHKDDPNYKPTNKEILEKTEELIKLNNKEYRKPLPSDSRKRVVVIHENEKIKLTA